MCHSGKTATVPIPQCTRGYTQRRSDPSRMLRAISHTGLAHISCQRAKHHHHHHRLVELSRSGQPAPSPHPQSPPVRAVPCLHPRLLLDTPHELLMKHDMAGYRRLDGLMLHFYCSLTPRFLLAAAWISHGAAGFQRRIPYGDDAFFCPVILHGMGFQKQGAPKASATRRRRRAEPDLARAGWSIHGDRTR